MKMSSRDKQQRNRQHVRWGGDFLYVLLDRQGSELATDLAQQVPAAAGCRQCPAGAVPSRRPG